VNQGVRFERVSKRFGAVTAVDDVTLDVAAGEFVTLLGPSGSGKTTLLSMALGVFGPDAGEIHIDGRPITRVPINKRNIGMVFQNYALFPHMTVADNIAFPLKMRGMAREAVAARVEEMLALVRLAGLGGRYARQLSGGQQQRVATARALAASPPLVLMDEPLGALDRKLREDMQIELRALQKRLAITTLYVTHDQGEAISMSDRIAVMNLGRLQQIGTPRELFEAPANVFVAGFLGNANLFRARVAAADASACTLDAEHGFVVRAPVQEGARPERGAEVWVMVRPERIGIAPAGGGYDRYDNRCRGVVREAVYAGTAMKYVVAFANGSVLHVERPIHDAAGGLAIGAEIELGWRAADTRVLLA